MMKQKRIVAVALGLALSVSPMIMLPTAFADQVSGNPSSSISARSTAPNPLDKFSTAEKAFLNNHKDEIASALGIDRFDPSTTDYFGVKESALDTIVDKIPTSNTGLLKPMGAPLEIDTNAAGWLVDGKITQSKSTSGDLAYRVTIKGKKSGGTVAYTLHTASQDASSKADPGELKGVTATANGTAVKDFNPVKDGTYTVPDGAEVKLSGLPDGWASYKNLDAKPGTLSYDIKKGDVTVVTWTFTYDSTTDPDKPATGADALKGVVATVDGKPLPSFDPTKSGTYRVAKGAQVKILNVPSDWKLISASNSKLVFTASKDGTTVTWTFEYQGKDDDGATINPDDNAGNNSQNNNDGTTSKPPANGVSPLASTGVGIGWVGWLIGILVVIGGALGITAAVRKPKGKATDETPEADDSEASSDQPRNA